MRIMENHQTFLETDLSEFEGRWVAIVDKKIVATGKVFKEVAEKVRRDFPKETPLIAKAPSRKPLIL